MPAGVPPCRPDLQRMSGLGLEISCSSSGSTELASPIRAWPLPALGVLESRYWRREERRSRQTRPSTVAVRIVGVKLGSSVHGIFMERHMGILNIGIWILISLRPKAPRSWTFGTGRRTDKKLNSCKILTLTSSAPRVWDNRTEIPISNSLHVSYPEEGVAASQTQLLLEASFHPRDNARIDNMGPLQKR
jgi:hypothetical protein